MNGEDLEREVRTWLAQKLGVSGVGRDELLISSGLIASGDLVRLATQLERLTGLEIPDQDIDADHMDTLGMIVAYVEGRSS